MLYRHYNLGMRQQIDALRHSFSAHKLHLDLALLLSILFIALAYLLQFAFNPAGAMQGDSASYGAGQARDWDLLSFTGQSLRNWPPVLLYLIFSSDVAKVFFQFVISFSAVMIMLMQINSQFKGKTRFLLIVLFSCLITTPQIITWNSVLLSESILLSVTILFVVSLRTFVLSGGAIAYWPLLMTSYLWCILKTTNVIVLSFLFLSLLILISHRAFKMRWNKRNLLRLGGFVAFGGILFVTLINQPNQEFNRGFNYRTNAAIAVLANVNPRASVLHAELSKVTEVRCLEVGNPKSYEFYAAKLGGECQEAKIWLSENFYSWYAKFLLAFPQEPIQLGAVGFIAGNTPFSMYAPSLNLLPKPIQDVFFGERNFALRSFGFQPYGEYEVDEYDRSGMEVTVPIVVWLGIAYSLLLILTFQKRLRGVLRVKAVKLDFILVTSGVVGTFINSIAVPTEWFRENIYFFIIIYTSLIYLIGDIRKELGKK